MSKSRYIIIFETGDVYKAKAVSARTVAAQEEGQLDIIDTLKGKSLMGGVWVDLADWAEVATDDDDKE